MFVTLFRLSCAKSPKGPLFLNLEAKWHPTMGTAKSFQDSITQPLPEMVKNIAFPGIFYRINQFSLGKVNVMVRTQVSFGACFVRYVDHPSKLRCMLRTRSQCLNLKRTRMLSVMPMVKGKTTFLISRKGRGKKVLKRWT